MESRAAIKVGMMVLIGAALFTMAWLFLTHGLYTAKYYTVRVVFTDAKGLLKQTPVRMNGVTVGEVQDITLSDRPETRNRPVAILAIERKFHIPADSTIGITSGLLISNPQIEIKPGAQTVYLAENAIWPRQLVMESGSGLAQLSPEADVAVHQLTLAIKAVNQKLPATLNGLQGILKRADAAMTNLQGTTASMQSLVANPKIRQTLNSALDDMAVMSREARKTAQFVSTNLRAIVKRNEGKFDELANGAVDLLQKLADTVDAARSAVTRLTEQVSDPRIQQSLLETLDLTKTTIARFNQIASDIHQLTGDPTVQSDLKTAVTQLKETAEQAKPLMERINAIVSAIPVPSKGPKFGIGAPTVAIDLMSRTNSPHFRSDVNLRVPIGKSNAFNLGLYDFAERYNWNAQYETGVGRELDFRYGVYASKLGVGLDWKPSPGTRFVFDAFDPNRFQVDSRGMFRLSPDFWLLIGADSIFKNTTPLIGVRLQR